MHLQYLSLPVCGILEPTANSIRSNYELTCEYLNISMRTDVHNSYEWKVLGDDA